MRVELQPAYVIHRRPYRDTSALLDVFTPEHGRVGVVAKGVRNSSGKSARGAMLQPFRPLLLSFSGRSELKTLVALEAAQQAPVLVGERLFSGLYINELLVRLLHRNDAHPLLFALYSSSLEALAGDAPLEGLLRSFELGLLEDLGYRLEPGVESGSGEPVREGQVYRYEAGRGMVRCDAAESGVGTVFAGSDLLAMAQGEWGGPVSRPAKLLLRQALAIHLGDKPLRSRALFQVASGQAN